jgi:hypothetical protein
MRDPCIPTNPDLPHSRAVHVRARTQNRCVVCGQENPHGLRIHYVEDRDGGITAEWQPTNDGLRSVDGRIEGQVPAPCRGRREPANPRMGRAEGQTAGQDRGYPYSGRWFRTRPRMGQFSRSAWPDSTTQKTEEWAMSADEWPAHLRIPLLKSREEAARGLLAGYFDELASIKENRT